MEYSKCKKVKSVFLNNKVVYLRKTKNWAKALKGIRSPAKEIHRNHDKDLKKSIIIKWRTLKWSQITISVTLFSLFCLFNPCSLRLAKCYKNKYWGFQYQALDRKNLRFDLLNKTTENSKKSENMMKISI